MAPISPDNTPRFRCHYETVGREHTLQVRSHASPSFVGSFLDSYFSAFGVTIATMTVDFVDWAPAGSDIFNPVVTGIEANNYVGGSEIPENAAWTYTFIGRTSGGKRVRFTQYGALFLGVDYRISAGESSPIDAVVAVLVGAGALIVGIDDLVPIWHAYADCNVNDHWVKRLRP